LAAKASDQNMGKKLLRQLFRRIKKDENSLSLAVVGSFARHPKEKVKNIDLLLLQKKALSPRKLKKAFLAKNTRMVVSDDATQFLTGKMLYSIVQLTPLLLDSKIKKIFTGRGIKKQKKEWCFGWWVPEAFCGDIATAKIIFDKTGQLFKWKKRLSKYPTELKERINANSHKVLVNDIKKYRFASESEKTRLLAEGLFEAVRANYANQKKYFLGASSLKTEYV
jgi:hypothetical protein